MKNQDIQTIQTKEELQEKCEERIGLIVEKNKLMSRFIQEGENLMPAQDRIPLVRRVDKIMGTLDNIHELTTVFRVSRQKDENASE